MEEVERLKEAVWKTWLRSVKSGMGSGTPTEMVKEYGFTGHFAGLNKHFRHPLWKSPKLWRRSKTKSV